MNPVITTIRYTEFPVNRGVVAVPDGAGKKLGTSAGPANFILIRGGRDFVTCEDIVRAADERTAMRAAGVINALILSTVFFFGAFALIELVLHCDELFR